VASSSTLMLSSASSAGSPASQFAIALFTCQLIHMTQSGIAILSRRRTRLVVAHTITSSVFANSNSGLLRLASRKVGGIRICVRK